ncbi:DUF4124 domain-containing protein [Dyella flagellata]|uniref:DUF4124 domain-containing protein n=1 Tax=Dyella flagellata TaxID=1867833 RepID=A0ABQ5XH59_9GAMM|nr:DUF4124 domain-containing protein [Dyella flagellata]GLQ90413.1 hypothetical protein GCM10007898_39890 [Dyella flagellata]
MRRLSIALALLLIAPLACAQVYKWTDAHGTVHYSETPPPTGTKYSQVSVNAGTSAPAAQENSPAAASSSSSSSSGSGSSAPQAPMQDTPENRAKLCTTLKASIGTLEGKGPVVMSNGGQQQLLNADQRKQQLDASQSQYSQFCANQ